MAIIKQMQRNPEKKTKQKRNKTISASHRHISKHQVPENKLNQRH